MIEVSNLAKIYVNDGVETPALNGVSFSIGQGEFVAIMGPSGSGKSTLVQILGLLDRPSGGRYVFEGKDSSEFTENELARLRNLKMGFVFQSFNLLSALTAQENAAIPLITAGVSKRKAFKQAREQLAKLHLDNRLDNLPKDLSGGEKQRVAVARALANEPMLILADEPTANLDTKTGSEVMQLLCNTACAENRAVVIVSHDARLKEVAKRVITIEDGRLVKVEKGNHEANCPMEHKHAR